MKVLVIGSGGREHALVWKLRQSNRVRQVYCIPGNGGICAEAECVAADVNSLDSLLEAAHRIQPDLTVVGPEGPLSLGVVDEFQRRGLRIFGPRAAAARLESSKSFAKEFMYRHRIPTARYAICDSAGRGAREHRAVPRADRGESRRAGRRQGRGDRQEPRRGAGGRLRNAERQDGGRGRRARGAGGISRRRRTLLPGAERRRARHAAGGGPGPQARRRRRHRAQHRRHGRVFHPHAGGRHDARLAGQPHRAPGGVRHARGRRRVSRHPLLRTDHDRARADGAGIQRALRRPGDAAHGHAPGKRPAGRRSSPPSKGG